MLVRGGDAEVDVVLLVPLEGVVYAHVVHGVQVDDVVPLAEVEPQLSRGGCELVVLQHACIGVYGDVHVVKGAVRLPVHDEEGQGHVQPRLCLQVDDRARVPEALPVLWLVDVRLDHLVVQLLLCEGAGDVHHHHPVDVAYGAGVLVPDLQQYRCALRNLACDRVKDLEGELVSVKPHIQVYVSRREVHALRVRRQLP